MKEWGEMLDERRSKDQKTFKKGWNCITQADLKEGWENRTIVDMK